MTDEGLANPRFLTLRWLGLLFIFMAVLTVPFILFESEIEQLAIDFINSGFSKVRFAAIIAAAMIFDVILPVPSSVVSVAAGAVLGFAAGTVVCWISMTLGCLFGYWLGASGGTVIVQRLVGAKELSRASRMAVNFGGPALVLFRAVPVLAELSTIAAGTARYPLGRFIAITAVGNLGIAAAYAAVGAFAWSTSSVLLAFAGAVSVPVIAYCLLRLTSRWTGLGVSPGHRLPDQDPPR